MIQTTKRKLKALIAGMALFAAAAPAHAQDAAVSETYGNTLNVGLGLNYGSYSSLVPAFSINYEFDINKAPGLTIAPFISFYSYSGAYYYHSMIPIGAKGTYYFDALLNAPPRWDFYGALSLGFVINNVDYDYYYYGPRNIERRGPMFASLHAGAQYNFSQRFGLYLDLSTGMSTLGAAFRL